MNKAWEDTILGTQQTMSTFGATIHSTQKILCILRDFVSFEKGNVFCSALKIFHIFKHMETFYIQDEALDALFRTQQTKSTF